jgi:signal transduction histidine kinase
MKWYQQLRWKLFASHLVTVVIAYLALFAAVLFLLSINLTAAAPLSLGGAAAETGRIVGAPTPVGPITEQYIIILQQALLISGFAALAASVPVSLFVSRRIVDPLVIIGAVSRRLAQGAYRERTALASRDELAQLADNINQLADTLDRTEQRRMTLLADVTHELRTPLATIGGYMEGLLDGVVAPSTATFHLISQETARLQRLIEDLELLSRAEAGQLPTVLREQALAPLLREQMQQFDGLFASKGVVLRYLEPGRELRVLADADRFAQIMINLLTNAYRYTLRGEVAVEVEEQTTQVVISVRDSGIGIAAEHLPHVFERFYRVDKSRARQSGGSGIGLAVVRHLVYAHGGDIWVRSAGPGLGSTFSFTLVRAQPPVVTGERPR